VLLLQAEENPSAAGNDTDAGGGYDGKVRTDIDHKTYLPPSWRVDDYLDRDDLDASLDDLCTHKLAFTKNTGRVDDMARNMTDNVDDYVVVRSGRGTSTQVRVYGKADEMRRDRRGVSVHLGIVQVLCRPLRGGIDLLLDRLTEVFRKTVNANPEWAAKNLNNAQVGAI